MRRTSAASKTFFVLSIRLGYGEHAASAIPCFARASTETEHFGLTRRSNTIEPPRFILGVDS
jgi:hypothetical protein